MMKNGIWINERDFLSFAETKQQKPLMEEVATRQRSLTFFSLSNIYLPNPDPILRKEGRDVSVYRDMLVDDRISGNLANRKGAVLSLEWEIDRGERGKVKSKQARAIEEWVAGLDIQRIMGEILDAMWYGYQPLEILWENRGGLYLPRDVVGKPPEWFIYNQKNELLFRSRSNALYGEELPPRSFVVPRHNASYYFPYGLGDAAACFWPTVFKKGGWKFWVQFAEKYGQAFAVGKIRRGATPAEMDELADKLEQMVQDAIAVIYDDSSVELMSDQGKGASSDLFQALITEANTAISTVILGHAGAGQSTAGKLGNEDLAQQVRKDIVDAGKKLICQSINQVIRWIGEVNWGSTAALPTFGLFEEEEVDKTLADRDDKLSGALEKSGLKFAKSYFVREYNLQDDDIEDGPVPGTGGQEAAIGKGKTPETVSLAEGEALPGEQEIELLAGSFSADELQKILEGALKPVFKLFNESGDLAEMMGELVRIFPDMDTDTLQDLLARVMFIAEVWGRIQAEA